MFNACTYIGGGRFYFRMGQLLKKRTIRHHRLLFIEQGSGFFRFPDISMKVKAGDIYLLAPGPREAHYNKAKPVTYEYIEFDSPNVLIATPCVKCRISEPFRSALIQLIRCTVKESSSLRRDLIAMAIRIALHDTSRHVTGDPRLRQVILNIEEHPGQSISVTKLAALAGLSEAQLRRIFHAELHTSPKRYLMHVRMNYARNLIRSEGLRVQEAADTLGFPSAFQFSAQYRKIHGVSPSHDLK